VTDVQLVATYLRCLEPEWRTTVTGQKLYAPDCSTGFVWKPNNQTVASTSTDGWVTSAGWIYAARTA